MARRYESALRAEQVERTHQRLIEVARDLLVQEGLAGLTLPKLAAKAGVSVPTVYRHFPTTEDLLAAFLAWLRPLLGATRERLLASDAGGLASLPNENFPRFEEHKAVLLPLMDSPVFHRVRVGSGPNTRKHEAAARLRSLAPTFRDDDLQVAAGAVFALISPQTWRWLRETWDLDAADTARASSWAVTVLLDAIAAGRGLGATTTTTTTKAAKTKTATRKSATRKPPRTVRKRGART